MALASLALLLAAPPALPAPQDVLEVLVKSDDVLPVGTDAFTVLSVPRPTAGIGGGWVTPAFGSFASSAPDTGIALIGRRPGQGTSGAEVLRAPQTLAGRTQRDLRVGAMINGQIAYLAFTQSNPFETFPDTVWLEDELIAAAGDTIPGGTDTWSRFIAVKATTNDTLIIHGTVGAPGTKGILVEWPTGRVLHEDGVQYPGLPDLVHVPQLLRREPVR